MQTPSFNFQKKSPEYRTMFGGITFRVWLSIGVLGLIIFARILAAILAIVFNSQIENTEGEIQALSPKWSTNLEDNILNLPTRVEKTRSLLNDHVYGSKLFDFLRANTLKKVVINSVNINAKTLSLDVKAQAASYNDLARQIVWLKSLKNIDSIKLSGISLGDKGLVDFSLGLKLAPTFFKNTP